MFFLFILFIVIPIVELYIIVQVAQTTGVFNSIALLILVSLIGAWLVKAEGTGVLKKIRQQLMNAEMPDKEIVDGDLKTSITALQTKIPVDVHEISAKTASGGNSATIDNFIPCYYHSGCIGLYCRPGLAHLGVYNHLLKGGQIDVLSNKNDPYSHWYSDSISNYCSCNYRGHHR